MNPNSPNSVLSVSIAVSKDGTRAVAAVSGGGIYTLKPPPLNITNSSAVVSLLWSTNYIPAVLGLVQNCSVSELITDL